MSRYHKTTIELTDKQLQYLSSALFEFEEGFQNTKKSSMFKTVEKKLYEAHDRVEKVKEFYAIKNAHRALKKCKGVNHDS